MGIIIYSKDFTEPTTEIKVIFEALSPRQNVKVFSSVDDLAESLLTTFYQDGIVVLMAKKREELSELMPILPLFRRVRIILLLPDQEPETIKIGYSLEPRFLSCLDNGLSEVKSVVQKMLKNKPRIAGLNPDLCGK
jgi:hypothetical protein